MLSLRRANFSSAYRQLNSEVMLSHIRVKPRKGQDVISDKNMIVLHGLLGNRVNFRTLCAKLLISEKRSCYLVGMRNHATSDFHDEHNYEVMADDVIRFAD